MKVPRESVILIGTAKKLNALQAGMTPYSRRIPGIQGPVAVVTLNFRLESICNLR